MSTNIKPGSIEDYVQGKINTPLARDIEIKSSLSDLIKKGVAYLLVPLVLGSTTLPASIFITKIIDKSALTEEINIYNSIINKVFSLVKEKYNPQTPYEWFAVLRVLYYTGVFAPSTYYPDNDHESRYEPGMSFFTSNGVCRHHNEFFTDILKLAGFDATPVVNTAYSSTVEEKPLADQIIGNHIYTMVVYEGKTFILDYINNCIFHNIDGKWHEIIYEKAQTSINPISQYLQNNDVIKLVSNMLFKSAPMTTEESNKIYDEFQKYYWTVFAGYAGWINDRDASKMDQFYWTLSESILPDINSVNEGLYHNSFFN